VVQVPALFDAQLQDQTHTRSIHAQEQLAGHVVVPSRDRRGAAREQADDQEAGDAQT
jgi:hypothetical protein